jgi:hypothetical protein
MNYVGCMNDAPGETVEMFSKRMFVHGLCQGVNCARYGLIL